MKLPDFLQQRSKDAALSLRRVAGLLLAAGIGLGVVSPGAGAQATPATCISPNFSRVGNATLQGNAVQLTPNLGQQIGAAWYNTRADLDLPFDYTAKVYLGNNDGGADGMTFTLQNSVKGFTAVGVAGRSLAAGFDTALNGAITPSLTIELDTFSNTDNGWADPAGDHIAAYLNGDSRHNTSSANYLIGGPPTGVSNLEDGAYHNFRVVWTPGPVGTGTLQYYLDGTLRGTINRDIRNDVGTTPFWGYTASTGGATNQQIFCNESIIPAATADVSITKTDGVTSVNPGQATTYTIVVANPGPSSDTVYNAVFTDPKVTNLTVTGVTCGGVTGGGVCPTLDSTAVTKMQDITATGGIVIPTLPKESSVTFTVNATVNAGATGSIANTATVATAGYSDPTGNNSAIDTDTIEVLPATATAKCAIGSPLNLLAPNPGFRPPDGSVYAYDSAFNDSVIEVRNIGRIANADKYSIGAGPSNRFIVDMRWNWSNSVPTASSEVTTFTLRINGIGYAVMTTVNGSGTVGSIVGLNGASVSQGVINASPSSIGQNSTTRSYVVLPVLPPIMPSTIPNLITSADIVFDSTAGTPGNGNDDGNYTIDSIFACPPILNLSKNSNGPWTVGQTGATYTLSATNTGPMATFGTVFISDTLPSGITVPDGAVTPSGTDAANWTCTAASNVLTCTSTVAVAAGGSTTFTFPVSVTANAASSVTNYASISGGGGSPNAPTNPNSSNCAPTNLCASNKTTVTPSADLSINKTGSSSLVQGSTATYTIKVWNQGPSTVTGATITDTVPSNLTNVDWTCAANGTASCGTTTSGTNTNAISFVSGLLPVNASATPPTSGDYLTITVTGTASTSGSLTNTATVAAPSGTSDPVPGNNTSSQATTITPPVAVQPNIDLKKYVRNVTTGTAFSNTSTAKPKDIIEYCIAYINNGGNAANFVLTDNVPAGMVVLPDAYGAGTGIRWSNTTQTVAGDTAAPAGSTPLTNASDSDVGTLTGALPVITSGTHGTGVLTLNLGATGLPTNGKGTVCFQTQVP